MKKLANRKYEKADKILSFSNFLEVPGWGILKSKIIKFIINENVKINRVHFWPLNRKQQSNLDNSESGGPVTNPMGAKGP